MFVATIVWIGIAAVNNCMYSLGTPSQSKCWLRSSNMATKQDMQLRQSTAASLLNLIDFLWDYMENCAVHYQILNTLASFFKDFWDHARTRSSSSPLAFPMKTYHILRMCMSIWALSIRVLHYQLMPLYPLLLQLFRLCPRLRVPVGFMHHCDLVLVRQFWPSGLCFV